MIKDYLKEKDIPYTEEGKNVSAGWINISCPFCEEDSNHLGISPTGGFNCWVCGESGYIVKLIKKLESCSWSKAKSIAADIKGCSLGCSKELEYFEREVILPKYSTTNFPQIHLNYFKKRGFNSRYLIHRYNLSATHLLGEFKFSIIIPVYLNKQLVTFTTINVKTNEKLHLSNDKSVIPIKSTLYNIDNVKDYAIVVEGVTDVWRIGDPAVALFGKKFTTDQIKLLKNTKRIVVLLDSDADKEAGKLSNTLSQFTEVEQIKLPYGDPESYLNSNDINNLKKY